MTVKQEGAPGRIQKTEQKEKGKFWRIYGWVFGILGGLAIVGLVVFWCWLNDYQHSQKVLVADRVTALFQEKNYTKIIELSDIEPSPFDDAQRLAQALEALVGGRTVSYVKAFSMDRYTTPIFTLKAGDQKFGQAVLRLSGRKSMFGFDLYELDHITGLSVGQTEAVFLVPAGYALSVNGITVGQEYLIAAEESEENPFRYLVGGFEGAPQCYRIPNLLSAPRVEALGPDGTVLVLKEAETGTYLPECKTILLTAPDHFTVTVNGIRISGSDQWVTQRGTAVDALQYMPDEYVRKPELVAYKMLVLGREADLQVLNCMGEAAQLTEDAETGMLTAGFGISETLAEPYLSILIEKAQRYSMAVTGDYNKYDYISQILPGTPRYETTADDIREYFYTDHSAFGFEDVKTENIMFYTENCFSGDISYINWIKGIRTDPNHITNLACHYRFWFVKHNGVWYIADWSNL